MNMELTKKSLKQFGSEKKIQKKTTVEKKDCNQNKQTNNVTEDNFFLKQAK